MTKRQLTYRIPLEVLCRTSSAERLIVREAINLNRECSVNYESLHTAAETFSTMVLTLVVDIDKCDYVHRAMQAAIALSMSVYSPSTDIIQVTDEPVMTRDFNAQEIL